MHRIPMALFLTVAAASGQTSGDAPDVPGQPVARISPVTRESSVKHSDSGDWVPATGNLPLVAGDSLRVGRGGRAEIQFDNGNFVRLGSDAEVRVATFDEGHLQLELARGVLVYRVVRDTRLEAEISTLLVSVQPVRQSGIRVEVLPDGVTEVSVRRGEADVASARGTETLREGRMLVARGNPDEPELQTAGAAPRDAFDLWSEERDRSLLGAQSTRYVSPDVFGAEDLDSYGRWDNDPAYGDVWTPTVQAGWTPYQNGQWVWQNFYGWTWVDESPWGWAPFHYGSWYQRAGLGWTWFPGRRSDRVWWRPGLVSFFGFGDGYGSVGWVPLAPFERYRPWYGKGFNGAAAWNGRASGGYRNWQAASGVRRTDFERGAFRNRVGVNREAVERGAYAVPPRFAGSGTGPVRRDGPGQSFFTRDSARGRQFGRVTPDAGDRRRVDNWSRFGAPREPAAGGGFGAIRRDAPVRQDPQRLDSRGFDSQRFGSPRSPAQPENQPRQSPDRDNSSWRRFGAPEPENRTGQDRFRARPAVDGQAPGGPRNFAQQPQGRQIYVAPPLVRRRQDEPSRAGVPSRTGGGGAGRSRTGPDQGGSRRGARR